MFFKCSILISFFKDYWNIRLTWNYLYIRVFHTNTQSEHMHTFTPKYFINIYSPCSYDRCFQWYHLKNLPFQIKKQVCRSEYIYVFMSVVNVGSPRTGVTESDSESPDVNLRNQIQVLLKHSKTLSCWVLSPALLSWVFKIHSSCSGCIPFLLCTNINANYDFASFCMILETDFLAHFLVIILESPNTVFYDNMAIAFYLICITNEFW